MKTTATFRDVVRFKHPGIDQAWIQRVLDHPLEERLQADGRHVPWGLVPEAGDRALRVMKIEDGKTVHNAFFDRGFRRQKSETPAETQTETQAEKTVPYTPSTIQSAMKISYFPDTDTLYIALSERESVMSEAINDNLIIDDDDKGRPAGLTVEHYSSISENTTIETLLPISPALQPA